MKALKKERREHERFELTLPCLLTLKQGRVVSDIVELEARDISAGGAFLITDGKNGIGAPVRIDIILPPEIIKSSDGSGTHISAGGTVVRSGADGIAVTFDDDYRVAPLDQVLRIVWAKVSWMERQKNFFCVDPSMNLVHFDKKRKNNHDERSRLEKA